MQRFTKFVLLLAVFMVTWRSQLVAALIGPPIKPTTLRTAATLEPTTAAVKPTITPIKSTTVPTKLPMPINGTTKLTTTPTKPTTATTKPLIDTKSPRKPSEQFHFGLQKMNWYSANVYCQHNNWKLVVLDSAKIQKEFEDFIDQHNLRNHPYWTAGNQLLDMKTWRWGIDGAVFKYTHWAKGEPNNYKKSQHCVKLYAKSLKWDDDNCEKQYKFVCVMY